MIGRNLPDLVLKNLSIDDKSKLKVIEVDDPFQYKAIWVYAVKSIGYEPREWFYKESIGIDLSIEGQSIVDSTRVRWILEPSSRRETQIKKVDSNTIEVLNKPKVFKIFSFDQSMSVNGVKKNKDNNWNDYIPID